MKFEDVFDGLAAGAAAFFFTLAALWLIKAWADRRNKQAEQQDLQHALFDLKTGYQFEKLVY